MTKYPYFTSLADANKEQYVPNAAHIISPWAILEISIKNDDQLHEIVELIGDLLSQYSISWHPTEQNNQTFWIAFQDENELLTFRLSV